MLQDKILQSMGRGHEVVVTNDGATILKSLYVDNPAAKVLVGAFLPSCAGTLVSDRQLTVDPSAKPILLLLPSCRIQIASSHLRCLYHTEHITHQHT